MKIDLGKTHGAGMDTAPAAPSESKNETYYPCAYASEVDGLSDLKQGDELKGSIRVKSITKTERDGKTTVSADLEILSLDGKSTSSEEKPKSKKDDDDEDQIDKGIDEASEDDSEKKKNPFTKK